MSEETNLAKETLYQCGYEDYVHSENKVLSLEGVNVENEVVRSPFSPEVKEQRERWYIEGWRDAKVQERKLGSIIFLLTELRKSMDEGGEWSGDDFDKPVAMLSKVLRFLGYDETPRNPSLPPEPSEVSRRLTMMTSSGDTGHLSGKSIPYAYATSYQHMFVQNDDGKRLHTFTANGIIALPDRNIVIQRDFEGIDRDALEQSMQQWLQRFDELLRCVEIREIRWGKEGEA